MSLKNDFLIERKKRLRTERTMYFLIVVMVCFTCFVIFLSVKNFNQPRFRLVLHDGERLKGGFHYFSIGNYNGFSNTMTVSVEDNIEFSRTVLHEYGHYFETVIGRDNYLEWRRNFCDSLFNGVLVTLYPQYKSSERCSELFADHFADMLRGVALNDPNEFMFFGHMLERYM